MKTIVEDFNSQRIENEIMKRLLPQILDISSYHFLPTESTESKTDVVTQKSGLSIPIPSLDDLHTWMRKIDAIAWSLAKQWNNLYIDDIMNNTHIIRYDEDTDLIGSILDLEFKMEVKNGYYFSPDIALCNPSAHARILNYLSSVDFDWRSHNPRNSDPVIANLVVRKALPTQIIPNDTLILLKDSDKCFSTWFRTDKQSQQKILNVRYDLEKHTIEVVMDMAIVCVNEDHIGIFNLA